jgi:hypothetical protein
MSKKFVITPGGRRAAELVQQVAPDEVVHVTDGRMRHVTRAGQLLRDVGPVPPHEPGVPLMPANVMQPPEQLPDFGTGWITFANFPSSTPLKSFLTTWVVPGVPQTQNGQLVYLFNGLQNSSMILQPVLQWGDNGIFGGDHWCVASWYADGQDGAASYTSPVTVHVGDTLVGRMTRVTGTSGLPLGAVWTCEFVGIADSKLTILTTDELLDCVQTLECYSITRASDYPSSTDTRMRGIAITDSDGTAAPLSWSPIDKITDCGQHTVIVDNSPSNGEVQLWYRDDILPGSAVAQGRWKTIVLTHELIPMHDGKVLDWVPGDGTWRLWNYDASSTHDVLPGNPVASGQWQTIRSGHQLIPMHDGKVLDWKPADGTWRLWQYDASSTHDVFPGNAVASGQWQTIRSGHQLVPMADGKVLDWVPGDGTWRLWNYDASHVHDVLPGNQVASGTWKTVVSGHTLVRMPDGRVLDWVPGDGTWRLWNYDATSVHDVLPGSPVDIGNWFSIHAPQQLLVMHDGKVLDWDPLTGDWRLWRYQP